MTPSQWQRIEDLYHAAHAQNPADREAFLDNECAGDAALKKEVLSLLAHAPPTEAINGPSTDAGLRLREGSVLGHYRVEKRLGAGGMGEVFRGVDTRLNRPVAIKQCRAAFSLRFRREALALSALNHPHICTLYDVGADLIVMELVEGETLEERLKRGPLPLAEVTRLGAQMADALATAHGKGITHRDLKPGNVMITRNGVKLLDFGLAAIEGDTLTQAGDVMGTPAYMAPEQRQGKNAGAPTDIYGLGLLLHEMATGQRPTVTPGATAKLTALPQSLTHIVQRCLAEDPSARWEGAGEVRALLEWAAQAPQAIAPPAAFPWKWVATAALLALAVPVALYFRRPPPAPLSSMRFSIPIPGGSSEDVGFALSPDGKNLAITAVADGQRHLWIRPIDSLEARLIPGTEGAGGPFWSPDSKEIGFVAGGNLIKVSLAGGAPSVLTSEGARFSRPGWSSQGVIFLGNARLLPADGGAVTALTGTKGWESPQFLPGGRRFLAVVPTPGKPWAAYVGSLDGMTPVRVLEDVTRVLYQPATDGGRQGFLLFQRGGRIMAQRFDPATLTSADSAIPVTRDGEISNPGIGASSLFSTSENGVVAFQPAATNRLTWLNRKGEVVETIGRPGWYRNFRLAPDGRHLAADMTVFDGSGATPEVARYDLQRGTEERLTTHADRDALPVWSPDSKRVAFTSDRLGGGYSAWVTTGPNQEKLLANVAAGGWPMDWSADGRFLLWGGGLLIVPTSGEVKPYRYLESRFGERDGAFSPDGRWIAYTSNQSGRAEVYIQRFPADGSTAIPVSAGGGKEPAWRRDGRELFFVAADNKLTGVPVKLGESSAEFGSPQSLFQAPPPGTWRRNYEVSPDGQRFLVSRPIPGTATITVVTNWQSQLGK